MAVDDLAVDGDPFAGTDPYRPISRLMASEVLPRARISSAEPRLIKAIMMAAASKYACRARLGTMAGNATTSME
jgi:hypothetical protein